MIVVLILGVLAAIAIPRITEGVQTARNNTCKTNVNLINRQLELYHENTGSWPETLDDFIENTVYFPDGPPECPFGKNYIWNTKKDRYRVIPHTIWDHLL